VKTSSAAIAVLLGLSGASTAAAEPIRLAQTLAADIVPSYEVFTIIRSAGLRPVGRPHYRGRSYVLRAVDRRGEEVRVVVDAYEARVVSVTPIDRPPGYDYPPPYRRHEFGPPPAPGPRVIEAEPRYVPPASVPRPGISDPRYGAPRPLPEDDDYPGEGFDEFDADDDGETGSLQPHAAPRSITTPRMPPVGTPPTRSAAVTPPKTPLPRPRPARQANAAAPAADKPQPSAAMPNVQRPESATPEAKTDTAKVENAAPAEVKAEAPQTDVKFAAPGSEPATTEAAKAEAPAPETPKSGIRIIEIKKPEPRI